MARTLLLERGYDGMMGKNTFSKNHHSGCSDYLDTRVVTGPPYIGLGLGAQSFSYTSLQYNLGAVTKAMRQYMKSIQLGRIPVQDLYHLSKEQALGKFNAVSFYYGGIHLPSFEAYCGESVLDKYADSVEFLLHHGLMQLDGQRL